MNILILNNTPTNKNHTLGFFKHIVSRIKKRKTVLNTYQWKVCLIIIKKPSLLKNVILMLIIFVQNTYY